MATHQNYIDILDQYCLSVQDAVIINARIARGECLGGIISNQQMDSKTHQKEFKAQARKYAHDREIQMQVNKGNLPNLLKQIKSS